QAQPSVQQVEDLPSQKGIEETQLDLSQNNPEAKVSTTNEEQIPAQVELPRGSVTEPLNMAQHDASSSESFGTDSDYAEFLLTYD
ncbi:hypothetical protein A2U01_0087106, partial [Trifolium medium]|nr:hypothetical protein [Trifolium medium]